MLTFTNLENAYKLYSNAELRRTYWLYTIMASPFVVKTGKVLLNLALFLYMPIRWIIKPTIFKQFCGGENLTEAAKTIKILSKYNVKAVLDYSVEGDETTSGFDKALEETLKTIKFASENRENVPFTVFKPSALGRREILTKASVSRELNSMEKFELHEFKNRINTICNAAYLAQIPVMIDAEHSYYQKIVDEVCEEMMVKYNDNKAIVFNTLQLYRTDRMDYFKFLLEKAKAKKFFIGIKFVRGAYMEKERERAIKYGYPSPIHSNKEDTDNDFNKAMLLAIENIDIVSTFCGTHNEESSLLLTQLMQEKGIKNNDTRIWFSQLYGMGNNISFNLAHDGYNVAKYIPFGPIKHVLPYLIRRTEENTSVQGQSSRELLLVSLEIERRRSNKTGKVYFS